MNTLLRRLTFAGGLFGVALLCFIALWKLSSVRSFQLLGESITRIPTTKKSVTLSFDDGPTPQYTDEVLNILARYQIKASFFVTGAEAERHRAEAQKIVAAGHELGNHSYSHTRMIFKSPGFIRRELERTDAAIRAAGWEGPIHFRPPYGKRLLVLPWILAQQRRLSVMWDIEPESHPEVATSSTAIARHVLERVQPGSIILLHLMYDSREKSRQALPLIIEGLKKRGYAFKTIAELRASPHAP